MGSLDEMARRQKKRRGAGWFVTARQEREDT